MSGLDGLRLDADGYLDLDVHGVGPDLGEDEVVDLRDALLSDPVEEPTAEEWEAFVDGAIEAEPLADGPFVVDDPPFPDAVDDLGGQDLAVDVDTDAEVDPDADLDPADAAGDLDDHAADAASTDLDPSSTELDTWSLDQGGDDLDLVGLDGGHDPFADDVVDDALPEVGPDVEDLL
jgi:hypothetical protein